MTEVFIVNGNEDPDFILIDCEDCNESHFVSTYKDQGNFEYHSVFLVSDVADYKSNGIVCF